MAATLVYLSSHARRRQSLPLRLKLQDIKAWPAANVLDAIQLVRRHAPDVLLVDLDAPANEERQILQQLMLHLDIRALPLVGLAPVGMEPDIEPYQDVGLRFAVGDDDDDASLSAQLLEIIRERSLNRPHVFLMEDDQMFAELLSMTMQEAGFRVTMTTRGSDALRLLRCASFDAIVTDIHVKEFSGIQLIEFLAKKGVSIPIIAITGAYPQGFQQFAKRLHIAQYFEKPFSTDAFINCLRTLMNERRQIAQ